MTITTDFNVFATNYHKQNGTTNPDLMSSLPNHLIMRIVKEADGGLCTHKIKYGKVLDELNEIISPKGTTLEELLAKGEHPLLAQAIIADSASAVTIRDQYDNLDDCPEEWWEIWEDALGARIDFDPTGGTQRCRVVYLNRWDEYEYESEE